MSTEGNACILVVDDEPAVLTLITTLLKKNGYDHLGANSARDALALFTKHRDKVDLLVSDIMVPEMDGFALTSAIHRLKPDLPVIFVFATPSRMHTGTNVLASRSPQRSYSTRLRKHWQKKPREPTADKGGPPAATTVHSENLNGLAPDRTAASQAVVHGARWRGNGVKFEEPSLVPLSPMGGHFLGSSCMQQLSNRRRGKRGSMPRVYGC